MDDETPAGGSDSRQKLKEGYERWTGRFLYWGFMAPLIGFVVILVVYVAYKAVTT